MNAVVETRYSVQGMKCGGCVAKASEALSRLPGYIEARFDLKSGTATVRGGVDPKAVAQALAAAGEPAAVKSG